MVRTVGGSRAAAGLTLVELLVVLAVLSLLSALVSPVVASLLPGYRLDQAADDLVAELRSARARAIGTYRPVGVYVDGTNRSYWAGQRRETVFPGGVSVEIIAARSLMPDENVSQIRFFPDGTSSGGRLTLSLDGRHVVLVVDWFDGEVQRER